MHTRTNAQDAGRAVWVWVAILAMIASSCAASTTVAESETDTTAIADATAEIDDQPEELSTEEPSTEEPSTEEPSTEEPSSEEPSTAEPSTDGGETSEETTTDSTDNDVAPGFAEVRLIDAGTEPRVELRLDIAATCAEILTMTQVQDITQTLNDTALPAAGAIGNVMEMSTSAVRSGNNYEVRSEVVSASAAPGTPPALAASLNAELSKIVGLTSFATITDRAVQVPDTSRVEGAEALGPFGDMGESLNQTQSPQPSEAVGVGARWETVSVIELQGLLLSNITETEIITIEGTVVEMRISGTQDVPPGSNMDVPGFTAEVLQWDSDTTGTTTIDLATISPIASTTTTTATQQLDFGPGPNGGLLEQQILTEVTASSAPDDGCTGRTIRG